MLCVHSKIKTVLLALLLLFLLATGQMMFASVQGLTQNGEATNVPDKPAKSSENAVRVFVEHEGEDSAGAKLSFVLKDTFNSSSLFNLSESKEPKLVLLLSTVPEFPSRPGIGSAYAVVWVFSQKEGSLRFYLTREVGTMTAEEIPGLAARLAERTYGIAQKYSYLFKNK